MQRPAVKNFDKLFQKIENDFFKNNLGETKPNLYCRKLFKWSCPNGLGHIQHRKVYDRLWHPDRCNVCSGLETITGINDLETMRKDIAEEIVSKNIDPSKTFWKSSEILEWKCKKCGNVWKTSIRNRTRDSGGKCGVCSHKKKVIGVNDLSQQYPFLIKLYSPNNSQKLQEISITDKDLFEWRCSKGFPHFQHRRIDNMILYPKSCRVCSNREVATSFNDVITTHSELIQKFFVGDSVERKILKTIHKNNRTELFTFKCSEGHIFQKTFKDFYGSPNSCSECSRTALEKDAFDFLKDILKFLMIETKIVKNDRICLNGKEIDILLPELHIGFEINGEYWHSRFVKENSINKHIEKQETAKENGVNLYFVWEDDFYDNQINLKEEIMKILNKEVLDINSPLLRLESNIKNRKHLRKNSRNAS